MRVANTLVLNSNRPVPEQIRDLQTQIQKLFDCLQGRVSFGVGTDDIDGQNISGQFQQFTSDGSANTEFNVAHTVGSIPLGYIILWQDKTGTLYQGPSTGTTWTSTQVSLKSTGTSVTYLVFLVKKSN